MTDFEKIRGSIANRFGSSADIPKEIFSDEAVYQHELEQFFYGAYWHPLAHRAELAELGSFKTTWLAEVPILITRTKDDDIKAFVNSCSHRGALLEQRACGVAEEFECPYHRWLFDNKGSFCGAPGQREFRSDFKREDYGLASLRVAEHAGLIFVTRDPLAPTLKTFLGDAAPSLSDCMLDDGKLELIGYQKVIYQANWKAYIDNDPYHAPLLHTAFKLLDWQGSKGELINADPYGHMCINYQVKHYKDNGFLNDPSSVEFHGTDDRARVVALRPVTGITKHLDTINVRFARPLGVNQTEVHYTFFGHQSDTSEYREHRIRQSSNLLGPSGYISIEDAAIYNRVQATTRDGGLAHFVKGVGKPREEWTQNDEASNTVWWEHYRDVMGFSSLEGE
ncbi:aromatic ring-hydroxylating dioxygenase subunit alpha [Cycloclasticus sp. P1]|jgi:anthranilate 1,2-dioxygenase large subunit|uniref:aromatic ring-hydroxylating oxygenase subunit alpha n=1 Tax=Cycloclasticus sp. (strain P1) TaxID=385025 RepID=UPI000286ACAC|nr:aromatic ring-hydroxylating dioxygenase subunit alpha [Cycloclasticus sp. P1]AFT66913.1 ring-hydroxylating dioxygenase large subunit [Cycloclasticus sp. P1]KXJ48222.1 MAG: (2Fe-2S)-binding protein [Cycloclasticus sp. Phe_18]